MTKLKYVSINISLINSINISMEFRRKLYKRGSSLETTIPKPLLFSLDLEKKHDVVFSYDEQNDRWYITFAKAGDTHGRKKV